MARRTALAVLILSGATLWGGAAEAACSKLAEAEAALLARDLTAGRQIAVAAANDPSCVEEDVLMVRGISELIRYNQIVGELGAGAQLPRFEAELTQIAAGGAPPWQVHDMLGDIARARKDYGAAASHYFRALLIGSNRAITPDGSAPPPDYIRYLHDAGTEMRLAANDPALNEVRGGCQISYRGVEIAEKTVPIRFVRSKAEFTPEGEKSAEALFNCLKSSAATDITLVGHTDPDGSEPFNLKLSEARAKTVADYLYAKGYNGKISLLGKGETELFKPDDPGAYEKDVLFQMHRRVDVVVNATL